MLRILIAVKPEWEGRMELAAEDYLHGIINVINELVSSASSSSIQLLLNSL